jgi:probable HAF family extracellular repeat protein
MKKSTLLLLSIFAVKTLTACSSAAGGPGPSTSPPPAFHFSVTAPTTAVVATAFIFNVTALDASNDTDTSFSGMVQFTSTDPHAALPATSALIDGVGNFSATFKTSGTQSITAIDSVTSSITATSKSIVVSATAPLTITSGAPPAGTVGTVYDARQGASCKSGSPNCICIIITGIGQECFIDVRGFPLTATGGTPPYNWTWTGAANSSLPLGLEIGSMTNARGNPCGCGIGIVGAPATEGLYNVIVTVTDSAAPPNQGSANYPIQINSATPSSTEAASTAHSVPQHHYYKLVDLGSTLGGPQSYFVPGSGDAFPGSSVLNSGGKAAGFADTSAPDPFPNVCFWEDCDVVHAFEAGSGGHMTDLGALPGGGSSVPMWISPNGLIAGISENGELDPLFPGLPQIRAVLWQQGTIIDLGTLPEGGYQSEANAVNSSGQVVGAALNTVPDPNSMQQLPDSIGPGAFWLWGGFLPYLYQTRAFIWDKHRGMQDLGTLGGTDAQAFLINGAGQVVGYSYTSSTEPGACFPVPTDSFIWEKDEGMRDLGSLGGTCTLAAAMNNRGQIVGESFTAGDQAAPGFLWEHGSIHELGGSLGGDSSGAFAINEEGVVVGFGNLSGNTTFHAALWRNANSITDLGVIDGDPCSYAAAINAAGQVVGASSPVCDFGDSARAFLWQEGSLFDLNTLIPSGSALYLQLTNAINDAGEIAGTAVDANGNQHAFLLIPCDQNHPGVEGCDYNLADAAALPEVRPPQVVEARAAAVGAPKPSSANPMAKFGPVMARYGTRTRRASEVSQ